MDQASIACVLLSLDTIDQGGRVFFSNLDGRVRVTGIWETESLYTTLTALAPKHRALYKVDSSHLIMVNFSRSLPHSNS
jgi:hypothetical protein